MSQLACVCSDHNLLCLCRVIECGGCVVRTTHYFNFNYFGQTLKCKTCSVVVGGEVRSTPVPSKGGVFFIVYFFFLLGGDVTNKG